MGSTYAAGLAGAVRDDYLTLEVAVAQHLQYNLYPPRSAAQATIAIQALRRFAEGDETPFADVTDQDGQHPRAIDIIEGWYLGHFVDLVAGGAS